MLEMKKFLIPFFTAIVLTFGSLPVAAVTMQGGENILKSKSILDDAYFVGGNANVKGDIFGDLYIAGGSVAIAGDVQEDLVVAGGVVTVTGNVFGDLRVIGGRAAIYGNVGDDLVVAGGQVDVGQDAVVGGSVLAGAGILTIDGVVNEDVRGVMGMLLLNGTVNGDVIVTIEDKIDVSEEARIEGDLKYSALLEASIPENNVGGTISFNKFHVDNILQNLTYASFVHKGLSYLSSLLIASMFVIFIPKTLTKAALVTKQYVLRSFGIGVLTMIGGTIGAIILMFTVIGIPIGLITLAVLSVLIFLAKIFAAAWMTSYFINYQGKTNKFKFFGGLALSLLAYYLIGLVPRVGWLVDFVLFLIGVGSLVLLKLEYLQFLRKKKMV